MHEGDEDDIDSTKPIRSEFMGHIPLCFNRKNEKMIILNMPNQKFDQRLGKITYNADVDPG